MARTDRPLLLEDGPWVEMRDSLTPTARHEGAYLLGQNVYPLDPETGDGVVGRPGTVLFSQKMATYPAAVNALYQFSHGTTEQTIAVAAGELYSLDWTTEIWTKVVTTANLTTAGASLTSTVVPVAVVAFGESVVLSDGVNTPFLWDGTPGPTGITVLTACPPLYGPPTVYEARLFGIKASDQRTFVWSEVDDATAGYEAGGFSNAWTLRQTDNHPLTRLVGTNDGLYIFRARSITVAVGDVGPNFATTATHDAIDSTVGTQTPFAVVEVGPDIAFLDAQLRPHLLRPGGVGVVPLWDGFRTHLAGGAHRANAMQTFAVHYTPANLILFAISNSAASTSVNTMLVLDASRDTPVPVAIWTGWNAGTGTTMTALGMTLNTALPGYYVPTLLHGDAGDDGGYIYRHGNPDDETFLTDDVLITGREAIDKLLTGQALGYSTKREKVFDRVDVAGLSPTPMTLEVTITTPRGQLADPQTIALGAGGGGWDFGAWDGTLVWDQTADYTLEQHGDVGIDDQARWVRVSLRHNTVGEQFGISAVTVTGYTTDDDPQVP